MTDPSFDIARGVTLSASSLSVPFARGRWPASARCSTPFVIRPARPSLLWTSKDRSRYWELDPAEGESVLDFEGFYLRGGFRVEKTISVTAKALAAFRAFVPR